MTDIAQHLEVLVQERISCLPKTLTLPRSHGATGRVRFVDRSDVVPKITPLDFDRELLDVRSVSESDDSLPAFDVILQTAGLHKGDESVRFDVSGYGVVELPIVFVEADPEVQP